MCAHLVLLSIKHGLIAIQMKKNSETTWFNISAWRQLGETCNTYVRKGMQVMVVGEIKARAYTSQSGEARATLELTARDVRFLTRVDDNMGGGSNYQGDMGGGNYQQEYSDDDIPF